MLQGKGMGVACSSSSLDTIPEPLVLETVMLFLGPMDLMPSLGSVNKRFRELSKSSIVWKSFCFQRSQSQIVRSMILDATRTTQLILQQPQEQQHNDNLFNNCKQSPSQASPARFSTMMMDPNEMEKSLWTEDDSSPLWCSQHYKNPALADDALQRIKSRMEAFRKVASSVGGCTTSGAGSSTLAFETYQHLHVVGWGAGCNQFAVGRFNCQQRPDPVEQAERLDGVPGRKRRYGNRDDVIPSPSAFHKGRCLQRTSAQCQWPGCIVGYCREHTNKQEWDEYAFVGEKWNRCSICRLELCHDCNFVCSLDDDEIMVVSHQSRWIESFPNITPGGGMKATCLDCRNEFT